VETAWKGNTSGHEVGRASAMVRSLRKLERIGDKGGGGDPLDGEGVQAVVFPREEKERKGGSSTGVRVGIES